MQNKKIKITENLRDYLKWLGVMTYAGETIFVNELRNVLNAHNVYICGVDVEVVTLNVLLSNNCLKFAEQDIVICHKHGDVGVMTSNDMMANLSKHGFDFYKASVKLKPMDYKNHRKVNFDYNEIELIDMSGHESKVAIVQDSRTGNTFTTIKYLFGNHMDVENDVMAIKTATRVDVPNWSDVKSEHRVNSLAGYKPKSCLTQHDLEHANNLLLRIGINDDEQLVLDSMNPVYLAVVVLTCDGYRLRPLFEKMDKGRGHSEFQTAGFKTSPYLRSSNLSNKNIDRVTGESLMVLDNGQSVLGLKKKMVEENSDVYSIIEKQDNGRYGVEKKDNSVSFVTYLI
jgi:hypothetical protein